jgi:hypothetical protein
VVATWQREKIPPRNRRKGHQERKGYLHSLPFILSALLS